MDLIPMREVDVGDGLHWYSVFTPEETNMHDRPNGWPASGAEVTSLNPEYRPDLCLNLHSTNMQRLARKLGFIMGDEGIMIPIEEFCSLATNWLRSNAPPSSYPVPLVGIDRRSVTADDILIEKGRLAVVVEKARLIAQEGAARGATVISIR